MKIITLKLRAVLALLLIVSVLVISGNAKALDTTYFDTTDAQNQNVDLVIGQTQFVQQTSVRLIAYFTSNSGSMNINRFNYCPAQAGNPDAVQNADYYDTHIIPANLDVTRFVVGGQTFIGQYKTTTAACNTARPVSLSNLPQDPNTGLYYAAINISFIDSGTGFAGILNYFDITLTGTSGFAIAQEGGGSRGDEVTLKQVGGTQNNTNFLIPFGSDCSITGPTTKFLYYYDIDNGGVSGAQQNGKITMGLYDRTADRWWNDVTNAWQVASVRWTPPTNDNARSSISFTALPDHTYSWRIYNVYDNNVFQFSTPFDGIYALVNCPAPTIRPLVSAPATVTTGSSVTFTLGRTVTGFRAPNRNVLYDTNYYFDSGPSFLPLPNDPNITNSGLYTVRGKSLPVTANITNGNLANTLTFTPAALTGHTRVCVQMNITNRDSMIIPNGANPASDCTDIVVPPTPPTITLVGNTYEKGLGGNVYMTATINCGTTNGAVNWEIVTATAGLPDLTGQSVNCTSGAIINNLRVDANAGNVLDTTGIGDITYTASITSPGGVTPSSALLSVFETPFARFYGHDVRVCGNTNANRFMWDNRGGQPAQKGSFAGLAAIFATAVANFDGLHTSTTSGDRDTLDAIWTTQTCDPGTIDMPTSVTPGAVDLNAGITKRYYTPGNTTIGGPLRGQVTIDSTGDVTITSNITSAIPTGGVNPTNDPVLLVKARNIYIASNVTRVDAILVATNDIRTCTTAGGVTIAPGALDTTCNTPLIINGAVNALGRVHFERTSGTRYLSNSALTEPGSPFNAPAAGNANPAETINFPAYLNFMPLNTQDLSRQGYDSYTVLPPRL